MTFLNIHSLITVPYSNVNRDENGTPKTVTFGDTIRARMSSQAQKRAARLAYEHSPAGERTSRTTFHADELRRRISELAAGSTGDPTKDAALAAAAARIGSDEFDKIVETSIHSLARKAQQAAAKKAKKGATETANNDDAGAPAKKGDAEGDAKKDTLIWLSEEELDRAARGILAQLAGGDELAPEHIVTSTTNSLAIAAFGRMFAARPDLQNEAAIQVAHGFTTHAAQLEIDFFTAVDDVRNARGDAASGHVNIAEFTSGTFYRFCSVNPADLAATWAGFGDDDAAERLEVLLSALLLRLPSGKSNVTAPHTMPSLVIVEETDQPLSYADAFEAPVRAASGGGFAGPSAERLLSALEVKRSQFGLVRSSAVLGAVHPDEVATFAELCRFASARILGR